MIHHETCDCPLCKGAKFMRIASAVKSVVEDFVKMVDTFNPFESDGSKDTQKDKERSEIVEHFAKYFSSKAQELGKSKTPAAKLFASEEGREWILDCLEELLDDFDDELDKGEIAVESVGRLASLFFLLLAAE